MTPEKIKNQLIAYNLEFKRMSGTFKSFEIVYDYVHFLTSEEYIKKLLSPILDYVDEQNDIVEDLAKNKGENIDELIMKNIKDPNDLDKIPVFQKIFTTMQTDFKNNTKSPIMFVLPIYLVGLSSVAGYIQEIKDYQKAGNEEMARKMIEEIKEKSLSVIDTGVLKQYGESKNVTTGTYLDMAMEITNKFIIDEIDAQAFLNNAKPEAPISFDKEKSLLYIRGQQIKIMLKNEKPIDHYILEAIFSHDLTEQTSFMEIAEDFRNETYDAENNWNRYYHACENLNKKIAKATNNKYIDFITKTSGKSGWCRINKDYL